MFTYKSPYEQMGGEEGKRTTSTSSREDPQEWDW